VEQFPSYAARETIAIALAVDVERAVIEDAEIEVALSALRGLLRDTEEAPSWEETYIQRAYRIGRFGM
jgi:hypothetical protein